MAKISSLDLLHADDVDGEEMLPVVKGSAMVRTPAQPLIGKLALPFVTAAETAAALAEAVSGPAYATTAAGLAATIDGQAFAVGAAEGLITVYKNEAGTAKLLRRMGTLGAFSSLAADLGAALLGFDETNDYEDGTAGRHLKIALDRAGFQTRAAAVASSVTAVEQTLRVVHAGVVLNYRRDAAGTALTTNGGAVKWSPSYDFVSPLHWGAQGDGVTDDGGAINAALAFYKQITEGVPGQLGAFVFNGFGKVYKTGVSLNATGWSTWGWEIRDMVILGHCTGKAVLDMIGSRGGKRTNLIIYGDKTDMPSVGLQCARAGNAGADGQDGYCDNCQDSNVHMRGYFSIVAEWRYGQETTVLNHCSAWNYNPQGASAFLVGTDNFEFAGQRPMLMQSDYLPPITGDTSFINNKYMNCDWRYLPADKNASIVAISRAAQMVITTSFAHPFAIGDVVSLGYMNGMPEAFGVKGTVVAVTATTMTLNVDSSAFSAYQSGGMVALAQAGPTLIFGRGRDHDFDSCYVVNYGGGAHYHVIWGDIPSLDLCNFEILTEGFGPGGCAKLITDNRAFAMISSRFAFYQVHNHDFVISADNTTTSLTLMDCDISVSTNNTVKPRIFQEEVRFTMRHVDITAYSASAIDPNAFADFKGTLMCADTGEVLLFRPSMRGDMERRSISGNAIMDAYVDAAGVRQGFRYYDTASKAHIFGCSAGAADYIMVAAAMYPASTNVRDLGLESFQFRRIYAQNFYSGSKRGVDSATFTTADGKTVTVTGGIITEVA